MNKLDLNHHISEQYNVELLELRNKVMAMGALVEQQIVNALESLETLNGELGKNVVYADHKVNALEVELDEQCSWIIARRQPTASDLRLLMTIIKVITDLERIGDEAEKIGHMSSVLAASRAHDYDRHKDVLNMGEVVRRMLHEVLDAFSRMDSEDAARIVQTDSRIDREYESVLRQIMTYMMEDPRTITRNMSVIWVARALERIGDHAKNICEYIIYLVEGRDVRHTDFADNHESGGKQ